MDGEVNKKLQQLYQYLQSGELKITATEGSAQAREVLDWLLMEDSTLWQNNPSVLALGAFLDDLSSQFQAGREAVDVGEWGKAREQFRALAANVPQVFSLLNVVEGMPAYHKREVFSSEDT